MQLSAGMRSDASLHTFKVCKRKSLFPYKLMDIFLEGSFPLFHFKAIVNYGGFFSC